MSSAIAGRRESLMAPTLSVGIQNPADAAWEKAGNASRFWSGCGGLSGAKWAVIRNRYKYRKSRSFHDFDITVEYAWALYEKQGGKCALTGLPIELGHKQTDPSTASLDRINSKIGYVEGNVQWIHKDINKMKNIFDQDYFIEMCKRVADHSAGCQL
jgi:hypothetical protein